MTQIVFAIHLNKWLVVFLLRELRTRNQISWTNCLGYLYEAILGRQMAHFLSGCSHFTYPNRCRRLWQSSLQLLLPCSRNPISLKVSCWNDKRR